METIIIMINPNNFFLQTRENMKIFSNRFFGINDGQSMKRIVESILTAKNT